MVVVTTGRVMLVEVVVFGEPAVAGTHNVVVCRKSTWPLPNWSATS
jgi:hypothetical protein